MSHTKKRYKLKKEFNSLWSMTPVNPMPWEWWQKNGFKNKKAFIEATN